MATLTGSWNGIGGYDLKRPADRVIAYDYDGTGKVDHLVCHRADGTIWILKRVSDNDSPDAFAAVYHGGGIGGYDLMSDADRVIAYDYDGTGKLDHLVCYRPGSGTIFIVKRVSNSDSPDAFAAVYHGGGIGGYDLKRPADRVIAYDYDGTGKLDHLVCHRADGTIWILKRVSDNDSPNAFATVYHGGGIGGYDLMSYADRVIAYDYDGTGKLDHLVCYRPGGGMIRILKKVGNSDSPDAFATVYHGGGIGGYDLKRPADRVIAYDYDGTGKVDHLVCHRADGTIWILKRVSDNDSPDAFAAVYHGGGIGGYDLMSDADRVFAYDYDGTGKLDHLVCYRPGAGMIRILKKVGNNDNPYAFAPVAPADPELSAHVASLFAALPDRGANVAGNAARAGLLNILKGGTPGSFSPGLGPSTSYRDVFFLSYAQGPPWPPTGQGDDWWVAFSVDVICQAIYYITSETRDQVRQPDVNNQVVALNRSLRASINLFYAGILADTPGIPVQPAFFPILVSASQPQAAQMYVSLLEDPAWISAKVGQATSGQWTDADWELLHHWLKLYVLGMTPAQIDAVIQALVAAQLPVPSAVGAGNWPSCALWMTPASIDWNDIRAEATPGMLAAWSSHFPAEEASWDFMVGGPGNQWSTHPSTSCFAAGAKVLMADDTLKNIEAIKPSEMVQSITGPRAVVTAVSLRHQGDRLYSFAGTDLRFSATHPFLTLAGASGQPGAAVAGVEPTWLMRAMPGVASRGVARLGPSGPRLAGFAGGVHPVRPGALQEHPVTPGAEMIYDLVTAFDGQGESHYCVGDGQTTFAVTSETPRFATAPPAAAAIMDIMAAAWPTIAHAMQAVPAAQWRQVLDRALRRVALSLFPTVSGDPPAEPEAMPDGWSTGPHLAATAHGLGAAVMTGGPQAASYDNNRGACLAAIVTVFGNLVRDAVATGWRVFLGADAAAAPLHAISALSFEVTGDAAPRGDGALTADMVIGEGAAAARHVLPAVPSNGQPVFFQQIADVAYVPRLQAKPGAPTALRVAFRDGAGNRLPLYGVTWLPDMARETYRRISVPLFDTEGTPLIVGQLLIDLRSATDASRAAETAARAAWTPAKATKFAHVLGRRIGAHLVAEFPAALAAVRT